MMGYVRNESDGGDLVDRQLVGLIAVRGWMGVHPVV